MSRRRATRAHRMRRARVGRRRYLAWRRTVDGRRDLYRLALSWSARVDLPRTIVSTAARHLRRAMKRAKAERARV